MNPVVQFKDVCFQYPGSKEDWAVNNVSFDVNRGEYISIIGANGSGKSTLAKLMNALILPAKGSIKMNGKETHLDKHVWEIRRQAGLVFQNPDNQIVGTTVENDIVFGLENLGLTRDEIRNRMEEALQLVGLYHLKHAEPHHLSGGQKQKVAIAGIIAMKPDVLILDEATSMLDPKGRNDVVETAKRLNKEEGITVIQITHFLDEVMESDRIMVMSQGRLHMQGTPREIFSKGRELEEIGLRVPLSIEIANQLREEGIPLSREILTQDELVEELWKYLSKD